MLIEAGFQIGFECPKPTPMLLQLNIYPTRVADLRSSDIIYSDPPIPMLTTLRMRLPVCPSQAPSRTRFEKAAILSSTA